MSLEPKDYAQSGTINPAGKAEAITKADADMAQYSRSIYVGGAGDLHVIMAEESIGGGSTVVIFKNVAVGIPLPIRAAQIRAATTATDIVVLF